MANLRCEAVVIGASAGAVEALSQLLPQLPRDFPPVMAVVHLPPDKKSLLAEVLKPKCNVDVREAEDKEPVRSNVVYLAPPDYHLQVEIERYLSLSNEEPVLFSRPSIDVLFETAADVYGEKLIGIILTGASADGAKGLKKVLDAGGIGLVQSPAEAASPLMPQAALDLCPKAQEMNLMAIGQYLVKAVSI